MHTGSLMPSCFHQLVEVLVVLDDAGDCSIVVIPLLAGDHAVVVSVTEVGEELKEGFIFRNLSSNYFWMSLASIGNSEVRSTNRTAAASIELVEGFVNTSLSGSIRLTPETAKELIKVNSSIIVCVQTI